MTLFVKTRICHFQVDEGGIKALLENSWTTFMKARVMCGAGNTQQQYNNMKQAVVLTAQDKRAGVMYGLFSNAWWAGAYCEEFLYRHGLIRWRELQYFSNLGI